MFTDTTVNEILSIDNPVPRKSSTLALSCIYFRTEKKIARSWDVRQIYASTWYTVMSALPSPTDHTSPLACPCEDIASRSSVLPHSSVHTLDTPPADLAELLRGFAALAETPELDKTTALTVTRLYKNMEAILLHERYMREREVSELRHTLERTHMQNELDRLARRKTLDAAQLHQHSVGSVASSASHIRRLGR